MNKLSKIFLAIIIILVIALAITINWGRQNLKSTLHSNEQVYLRQKAVDEAGFRFETQSDGSLKLVEGRLFED